jgi:PleD family two-component response regulator
MCTDTPPAMRCCSAVRGIRGHLRSYDLIVRIGGDEFLCVMSDATITEARKRFATVQAALTADSDRCEIKVGFAALAPNDSADELIRRADAELPTSPRRHWTGRSNRWRRRAARDGPKSL